MVQSEGLRVGRYEEDAGKHSSRYAEDAGGISSSGCPTFELSSWYMLGGHPHFIIAYRVPVEYD